MAFLTSLLLLHVTEWGMCTSSKCYLYLTPHSLLPLFSSLPHSQLAASLSPGHAMSVRELQWVRHIPAVSMGPATWHRKHLSSCLLWPLWRCEYSSMKVEVLFPGPSLILRSQPRSQVPASFSSPSLVLSLPHSGYGMLAVCKAWEVTWAGYKVFLDAALLEEVHYILHPTG